MGNDSVICETVRPTLSSLDVDGQRVGYEAAKLLDRMMAGKPSKDVVYIPPSHVVVRQSTDLVAIEDADVAQAVRIIRESACTGIDVMRVADKVGLSRRSLERRFRQFLGAPQRRKSCASRSSMPKCSWLKRTRPARASHASVAFLPWGTLARRSAAPSALNRNLTARCGGVRAIWANRTRTKCCRNSNKYPQKTGFHRSGSKHEHDKALRHFEHDRG